MINGNYYHFLEKKLHLSGKHGFGVTNLPDFLFDFQASLVEWALEKGRCAIFADCGLGKTPMQLVWANETVKKTNKPVLIATPLAVSYQTLREAEKFGIEAERSTDGTFKDNRIIITNYQRLHYFDPNKFSGIVCDESSILKNFDGQTKAEVTEFSRKLPYRLLCTATAAPNDYIELGTSSEALGELGYMDMLNRFFKNDQNTNNPNRIWTGSKWRFKHHAEDHFWKWVCSWSRAIRRPSDIGFSDDGFDLPDLIEQDHLIETITPRPGMLFNLPAVGLKEERIERRRTINERCEKVADIVKKKDKSLVWCHLNDEGDLLKSLIPGAEQVKGSDSDEKKEETFIEFATGDLPYLITKPKIGALGLNLQSCSHMTFFPSHSYEQYYQGVRRCWRYGQKNDVVVDRVYTEGDAMVLKNLMRKSEAADRMFDKLVEHMNNAIRIDKSNYEHKKTELPSWIK